MGWPKLPARNVEMSLKKTPSCQNFIFNSLERVQNKKKKQYKMEQQSPRGILLKSCTEKLRWSFLVAFKNIPKVTNKNDKKSKLCSKLTIGTSEWHRVTSPQARNFIKKEILAQVLSCESWEISKKTFP